MPTASAVLSDICVVAYDYRYEYKKITNSENLKLTEDFDLKVLFKFPSKENEFFEKYFSEIDECYGNKTDSYFIGNINFKNLKEFLQT